MMTTCGRSDGRAGREGRDEDDEDDEDDDDDEGGVAADEQQTGVGGRVSPPTEFRNLGTDLGLAPVLLARSPGRPPRPGCRRRCPTGTTEITPGTPTCRILSANSLQSERSRSKREGNFCGIRRSLASHVEPAVEKTAFASSVPASSNRRVVESSRPSGRKFSHISSSRTNHGVAALSLRHRYSRDGTGTPEAWCESGGQL